MCEEGKLSTDEIEEIAELLAKASKISEPKQVEGGYEYTINISDTEDDV